MTESETVAERGKVLLAARRQSSLGAHSLSGVVMYRLRNSLGMFRSKQRTIMEKPACKALSWAWHRALWGATTSTCWCPQVCAGCFKNMHLTLEGK